MIDNLTPEELKLFMEVVNSKIEDEVFMEDGHNYFPLVAKGLLKEIPNANFLAASVILTKKGKALYKQILEQQKANH